MSCFQLESGSSSSWKVVVSWLYRGTCTVVCSLAVLAAVEQYISSTVVVQLAVRS